MRVKGRMPFDLDETQVPVVVMQDVSAPPFADYPTLWSFPFSLSGDATHFGAVIISNPASSSGLIVIRAIHVHPTAAANLVQWGVARNSSQQTATTSRQSTNAQAQPGTANTNTVPPLARFSIVPTVVASVVLLGQMEAAANTGRDVVLTCPIVLYPGDDFIYQNTVNAVTSAGFIEGADYINTLG